MSGGLEDFYKNFDPKLGYICPECRVPKGQEHKCPFRKPNKLDLVDEMIDRTIHYPSKCNCPQCKKDEKL